MQIIVNHAAQVNTYYRTIIWHNLGSLVVDSICTCGYHHSIILEGHIGSLISSTLKLPRLPFIGPQPTITGMYLLKKTNRIKLVSFSHQIIHSLNSIAGRALTVYYRYCAPQYFCTPCSGRSNYKQKMFTTQGACYFSR